MAERAGVAPRLVRYYEQQGLVTAPRAENGYRSYTEEQLARLDGALRVTIGSGPENDRFIAALTEVLT